MIKNVFTTPPVNLTCHHRLGAVTATGTSVEDTLRKLAEHAIPDSEYLSYKVFSAHVFPIPGTPPSYVAYGTLYGEIERLSIR